MELQDRYRDRQQSFKKKAKEGERRLNQLSLFRTVIFLAGIAILILSFSEDWRLGVGATLLFLLLFIWILFRYQRIQRETRHHQLLAILNGQEVQYLNFQFQARKDGKAYQDPAHPYINDLDLFGPYSVFQYINRASTEGGQDRLAQWLSQASDLPTIQMRQDAVQEWRTALDWRQEWQALAHRIQDDRRVKQSLTHWLEEPPLILGNRMLEIALMLIPAGWMVVFSLMALGYPWSLAVAYLLLPAILLSRKATTVNRLHERTAKASDMLEGMSGLLQHFEDSQVNSEWLQKLQTTLTKGDRSLSKSLRRLSYYVAQLDVRYNPFAILLNLLVLWDFFWIRRLDQWKQKEKDRLPQGFDCMAEIEALQSLSANWYNNPDWVLPRLTEGVQIKGTGLGHPLIPSSSRVTNDLSIPSQHHLWLVTGSNMAGKSTFLRTVGLNLVLAQSGSPVCAHSMEMPLLQVFSSMRTQDKLAESTSSFFAELKRLHSLIQQVESGNQTIFYLLDEILKGTNSRDRHQGGEALIRQLIQSPSAGMVATHDLELGKLEKEFPEQIENWRLEVEIEGDDLHFDYMLKRGVSQSFNASLLMKKMGIRFEGPEGQLSEKRATPREKD